MKRFKAGPPTDLKSWKDEKGVYWLSMKPSPLLAGDISYELIINGKKSRGYITALPISLGQLDTEIEVSLKTVCTVNKTYRYPSVKSEPIVAGAPPPQVPISFTYCHDEKPQRITLKIPSNSKWSKFSAKILSEFHIPPPPAPLQSHDLLVDFSVPSQKGGYTVVRASDDKSLQTFLEKHRERKELLGKIGWRAHAPKITKIHANAESIAIHFTPMPFALEYHTQLSCLPSIHNPPTSPRGRKSPIIIRNLNPKRRYVVRMAIKNAFEVSEWGKQSKGIKVFTSNEVLADNAMPAFLFLIAPETQKKEIIRYELSAKGGSR